MSMPTKVLEKLKDTRKKLFGDYKEGLSSEEYAHLRAYSMGYEHCYDILNGNEPREYLKLETQND